MKNKFAVTVLLLVILKCDGQMPDKAFLDQLLYSQGIDPNDVIISVDPGYSHTITENRPWQQKPQVITNTEPETIIVVVEEEQPSNQQYGPPTYNYNTNYKPGYQNKPSNHQHRPGYNNQHGNHHHHHHHQHRPGYNNQHGNRGGNGGYHQGNNRPHNHYNPNHHNTNNGDYNQYPNTGNNEQDDTQEPTTGTKPLPGNVFTIPTNSPIAEPNKGTTAMESTTKPSNKPILVPLNPNQYMYQGDKIDINVPSNKPDENKKPDEENEEDAPIDIRFGD